jgi:predicted nucleic acid-binding protein
VIVVDTNVIAYLLIEGDQTDAARGTLARDPAWAAPVLWRSEFRNVLASYLRRGHLAVAEAKRIQRAAEACVAGREYHVESDAVLDLVAASSRSAYDCEFVALARALGVPLVTSDRQVLLGFPAVAEALRSFGSRAPGT